MGFHELVVIFQVSWVVPKSRDAGIGECVCTQVYIVYVLPYTRSIEQLGVTERVFHAYRRLANATTY